MEQPRGRGGEATHHRCEWRSRCPPSTPRTQRPAPRPTSSGASTEACGPRGALLRLNAVHVHEVAQAGQWPGGIGGEDGGGGLVGGGRDEWGAAAPAAAAASDRWRQHLREKGRRGRCEDGCEALAVQRVHRVLCCKSRTRRSLQPRVGRLDQSNRPASKRAARCRRHWPLLLRGTPSALVQRSISAQHLRSSGRVNQHRR